MIDIKDEQIEGSRFANRFKADHISQIASTVMTHNRRQDIKGEKPRREQFQNLEEVDFFGMRMIVVYNWLVGVACLCSKRLELYDVQVLAARYYFTQLWGEFTIEVLQDFQYEDVQYRKAVCCALEA